jgi:hypothetical protein
MNNFQIKNQKDKEQSFIFPNKKKTNVLRGNFILKKNAKIGGGEPILIVGTVLTMNLSDTK